MNYEASNDFGSDFTMNGERPKVSEVPRVKQPRSQGHFIHTYLVHVMRKACLRHNSNKMNERNE